jgi:hemoglobin-like flavoprotein
MRRAAEPGSVDDMTPEQLDAVEDSLMRIGPRLDDVASCFYERLFELEPGLRRLFPHDLATQQQKFSAQLRVVMQAIRHYDEFTAHAAALAAVHRDHHVNADGFRVAGVALRAALCEVVGDSWNDDLAQAWQRAYELTAEAVLAAMATTR